jgi:hypothetical protein
MKTKWKMLYLVLAIILFIIILIPLFQNVSMWASVVFFGSKTKLFTSAYMPIMVMSMVEWALIMLYLQSLLADTKKQDATKFDLSN